MIRQLDIRTFKRNRATPQRAVELQTLAIAISDRLPGKHRITIERLDPTTGNAAHVTSAGATATTDGNFIKRALDHVRAIGPALGVAGAATEFVADSAIQVNSGARAVQLQQRCHGIPVFQAVLTVRFGADGALQDTTGRTIATRREASAAPRITVKEAVRAAASYVAQPKSAELLGIDLTDFEPSVRVAFTSVSDRLTLLEAGPFGSEIKASLTWFALDDQLVLGWQVLLALPRHGGQYSVIIDAISGEPAYCQWSRHPMASSYRIGNTARDLATDLHAGDYLFTSTTGNWHAR